MKRHQILKQLGNQLLKLDNKDQFWSKGEVFHLVNHLDVLGIERGLMQVSRRLERDSLHVEVKYYTEKEKRKSTRNMAV